MEKTHYAQNLVYVVESCGGDIKIIVDLYWVQVCVCVRIIWVLPPSVTAG